MLRYYAICKVESDSPGYTCPYTSAVFATKEVAERHLHLVQDLKPDLYAIRTVCALYLTEEEYRILHSAITFNHLCEMSFCGGIDDDRQAIYDSILNKLIGA